MIYKVLTVYDRLTRSYEPIFEARTVEIVRSEILEMCKKTARKPTDYEIVHIADVIREDNEHGYMSIHIKPFEDDIIGSRRYEVAVEELVDG